MFFNLPLAFAVHFQAGAVDDKINLAVIFRNVNVDAEFRRPFRQRREVGYGQFDLQQSDERMSKAFGGSICCTKKLADHQQGFDGEIAVRKGPSTFCTLVFMEPMFDHVVGNPECELASFDEGFVVFLPIDYFRCFRSPCNDLSFFVVDFFVILFFPALLFLLFSTVFIVRVMI